MTAVPVAILGISLAGAAGAASGGRAGGCRTGRCPALLLVAGLLLAAQGGCCRVASLAAVAVFYAIYLAVLVVAEARLQDRIAGPLPRHAHVGRRGGGGGSPRCWCSGRGPWPGRSGSPCWSSRVVPVVRAGSAHRLKREPGQQHLHQRADGEGVERRCTPSVPPSSQPVATTATSIAVRTSRTEPPVRRDQPGHQAVARAGAEARRRCRRRWRRALSSDARRRRSRRRTASGRRRGQHGQRRRRPTSPITTTLLTVPEPGPLPQRDPEQQDERADDDR